MNSSTRSHCSGFTTLAEGLDQWSATGGPQAKTGPPAIISGPRLLPDYFYKGWFWNRSVMTATVILIQSMCAEWCDFEWSEEWIFYKSERHGFHSLQERFTTAPWLVKFMATVHNIIEYLESIHMLNIFSKLDREASLKSERMWRLWWRRQWIKVSPQGISLFLLDKATEYFQPKAWIKQVLQHLHAISLSIMHSKNYNITVGYFIWIRFWMSRNL